MWAAERAGGGLRNEGRRERWEEGGATRGGRRRGKKNIRDFFNETLTIVLSVPSSLSYVR